MTTARLTILDPTSESKPARRELLSRPSSIDGMTIGLLDIRKPRGDVFLDRIEQLLDKVYERLDQKADR